MRAFAPVEMMIACACVLGVADPDAVRRAGEVDAVGVGGHELGAEALGLLAERAMSSGPMIPSGKPG